MITHIRGMALLLLGLLVVADGLFQIWYENTGVTRWLYLGLGAVLVVRGIYVSWPFRKKPPGDAS